MATFAPVKDIGLLGGISTGEGSGKWWQAPHAVKRSRYAKAIIDAIVNTVRSTIFDSNIICGHHPGCEKQAK